MPFFLGKSINKYVVINIVYLIQKMVEKPSAYRLENVKKKPDSWILCF